MISNKMISANKENNDNDNNKIWIQSISEYSQNFIQ